MLKEKYGPIQEKHITVNTSQSLKNIVTEIAQKLQIR
jgi:hypothetical protein